MENVAEDVDVDDVAPCAVDFLVGVEFFLEELGIPTAAAAISAVAIGEFNLYGTESLFSFLSGDFGRDFNGVLSEEINPKPLRFVELCVKFSGSVGGLSEGGAVGGFRVEVGGSVGGQSVGGGEKGTGLLAAVEFTCIGVLSEGGEDDKGAEFVGSEGLPEGGEDDSGAELTGIGRLSEGGEDESGTELIGSWGPSEGGEGERGFTGDRVLSEGGEDERKVGGGLRGGEISSGG